MAKKKNGKDVWNMASVHTVQGASDYARRYQVARVLRTCLRVRKLIIGSKDN